LRLARFFPTISSGSRELGEGQVPREGRFCASGECSLTSMGPGNCVVEAILLC
jgi:hypothetical protein